MNRCLLEFSNPFLTVSPGIGSESPSWEAWVGRCRVCSRQVTHDMGLFCANFGTKRPSLVICQAVWCATCYCTPRGSGFFVAHPLDADGTELEIPAEEADDFLVGRPGDHLCCPFECDYCAFTRLTARSPVEEDHSDALLLDLIRRANLDAFWCQRPATIHQSVRYFREQVQIGNELGFEMFDRPGPLPWDADLRMRVAITMLWKSLRPGKHEPLMKFATLRKLRTVHTTLWQSSAAQLRDGFVLEGVARGCALSTNGPTDSVWFRSFLNGLRHRIGERRKQDMALTPEIVREVLHTCEEDLSSLPPHDFPGRWKIGIDACFFVLTYAGGLRSFEVSKVPLTALDNQILLEERNGLPPHVGLPLSGRFKSRGSQLQNIVIFLPPVTDSGIQTAYWLQRLIDLCQAMGRTRGWLFAHEDERPLTTCDFSPGFYERILRVHDSHPELFVEGVNVLEDYGPVRSGRRGAATQALKCLKDADKVDLFFRWNTGGQECSSLPMQILYAQQRELLSTALEMAQCL